MMDYELDPKLFHEVADYLEGSADKQVRNDAALAVLLCANIVRGFLKLSKARQVEINLLGSGLLISIAADMADDIRQVETVKELAIRPLGQN